MTEPETTPRRGRRARELSPEEQRRTRSTRNHGDHRRAVSPCLE